MYGTDGRGLHSYGFRVSANFQTRVFDVREAFFVPSNFQNTNLESRFRTRSRAKTHPTGHVKSLVFAGV